MIEVVRPDRPSFDEARAIAAAVAPAPREVRVPLADALGLITFRRITAARDYPAFDASAMDGFAFPASATLGATCDRPILLSITGESRAGGAIPSLRDGSACAISTGGIIPPGSDTVIPRERAAIIDRAGRSFISFDAPELPGRNVRQRGEDIRKDESVLSPGTIVTAEMIGALGCFGLTDLSVFGRPRIVIIPTGDELVGERAPSSIIDSNGPMIAAAAMALGLPVTRQTPVRDCRQEIEDAYREVLLSGSAQIIVSIGGVSVGDHDHVAAALRALGATIHFNGVRMRPGKPALFATFADGTLFFGLPGNPVAALVSFRFFVTAAIRAMMGKPLEAGEPVQATASGRPGTTVLLKALRSDTRIDVLPGQQSHRMRPFLEANYWLAVDLDEAGEASVRGFSLSATLA